MPNGLRAMRKLLPLLIFALLSACAGPQTRYPTPDKAATKVERIDSQRVQIKEAIQRDARAWQLLQTLLVDNKVFCQDDLRFKLPVRIHDARSIKKMMKGYSPKQIKRAGFNDELLITATTSNQLQVGDEITALNGELIQNDRQKLRRQLASFNMKQKESAGSTGVAKTVEMKVLRDGETVTVSQELIEQCRVNLATNIGTNINAYASGKSITVFAGLINTLDSDRDLALVLAHELAHALGDHTKKLTINALASGYIVWGPVTAIAAGLGDIIAQPISELATGSPERPLSYLSSAAAAASLKTPQFEREADYMALYFLKRAGFKLGEAEDMYQILTLLSPYSTYGYRSHPTVAERRLIVRATIEEINQRAAQGHELIPYGWIAGET